MRDTICQTKRRILPCLNPIIVSNYLYTCKVIFNKISYINVYPFYLQLVTRSSVKWVDVEP